MLSMKVIGSSSKAKSYYTEYAQEKGEALGVFYDRSGELGIDGKTVTSAQMEHLLQGFTPEGKDALCKNAGEHHRGGWDLTFSAPKSVSIVWANASPELRAQIEAAQEKATRQALDYLNDRAASTRMGHAGKESGRADMVAATFQHSSNRAGEPQLHTHAIVFNVAKSERDGAWRTMEGRDLFVAKMAAGAVYKAEMAHQLQSLGLAVERTKASFEVAGVPKHVMDAQSSRSKEVEAQLVAQGLTRETAPAHTKEYATLKGRASKDMQRITRDFDRWQGENTRHGFGPKEQAPLAAGRDLRVHLRGEEQVELGRTSLGELTKQASTFTSHDLVRSVAEASIGHQGALGVQKTVAKARDEAVTLGKDQRGLERLSTPEMIRLEQDLLARIKMRHGEDRHPVKASSLEQALKERPTIKPEQEQALRHVAQGKDGVSYIKGDAGTGKTYMMAALREVYEKSGYQVHGLSFTNKAAQGLEKDSGIKSRSVDSFLNAARDGRAPGNERSVFILDEAGMLDSRKTRELVKVMEEKGAKLVAVGDEKQIQPIMAGQAFGMGAKEVGSSRLSEIVRQKDTWERQAVFDLAEGRTKKALDAIDHHGNLKIHDDRTAARSAMLTEWHKGTHNGLDKAPLMVATTNAEVRALNDGARHLLKTDGRIKDTQVFETSHGKADFAAGERIVFTGTDKPRGIFNSTMATIQKVDEKTLTVKTETGAEITFKPEDMNKFRHAYAITAHKSQGTTADRALVMVDGYNTDREKLYVEFSRGRQGNQIYADKPTIGELSADDAKKLKALPAADRPAAEHQIFKSQLAQMVGTSHKKDTTQDYEIGRSKLEWERPGQSPVEQFMAQRQEIAAKRQEAENQLTPKRGRGLDHGQGAKETEQTQALERAAERGRGIER